MAFIMVDTEADGPIPGDYSMIALAAVRVEPSLENRFHTTLSPVSETWVPNMLAAAGYSREQTLAFEPPAAAMNAFKQWLSSLGTDNLFFISDNNGFDWQFVNWYFHHFTGANPFGFSSTNMLSLFQGLCKDMYRQQKQRARKRLHDPLQEVCENARDLLNMAGRYQLKIHW